MITEVATLKIDPARAEDFISAVSQAAPLFRQAQGCKAMSLEAVIETPGTYYLRVIWESVEHHTIGFRESEAFQQWRALAGPYFVEAPQVVHVHEGRRYF
ncbi:MAG: antibiotic biosynthesis monooxygenase family protein [Asticcacaulis sp.]